MWSLASYGPDSDMFLITSRWKGHVTANYVADLKQANHHKGKQPIITQHYCHIKAIKNE